MMLFTKVCVVDAGAASTISGKYVCLCEIFTPSASLLLWNVHSAHIYLITTPSLSNTALTSETLPRESATYSKALSACAWEVKLLVDMITGYHEPLEVKILVDDISWYDYCLPCACEVKMLVDVIISS